MGEARLGPIEWGVVMAHHSWGMGVRLEESGDEGVIVLDSVHDDFLRCNGEYWPEIGERIRVRRYIYGSPDDEVRLTSCESAMEGLVGGYDPPASTRSRRGSGRSRRGRSSPAATGAWRCAWTPGGWGSCGPGSWRAGPIPPPRSAGPGSGNGSASGPWASGPTAACD